MGPFSQLVARQFHRLRSTLLSRCPALPNEPGSAFVTFYFDLGSPFAYLTAERISEVLPEPVAWQPVSLGALFKLVGRSSWSLEDPSRRRAGMAEVERRAGL